LLANWVQSSSKGEVDQLTQETAHALDYIAVNEVGKVELRGSAWNARNVGPEAIMRGQRCRVDRVDGLMLFIRPEGVDR
jgi:membrane protein implicated in regulation of membrane protease activity